MMRAVRKEPPVPGDVTDPLVYGFYNLLEEFSRIPRYKIDRTIFDISGYPHYENVCSNILAFFFDPSGEHGMGDLFIHALLDCVSEPEDRGIIEAAEVDREVCANGKFLDLVLKFDGYVIGIENKVRAGLYNPLHEYDALLRKMISDGDQIVRIVLSLHSIELDEEKHFGFRNITYQQFFDRVKQRMGNHLLDADPKYQHYLFDFMKVMQRQAGGHTMNDAVKAFFIQNHQQITELNKEYGQFLDSLAGEVREVAGGIDLDELYGVNQWIYSKRCLVHDFSVNGGKLAIDSWLTVSEGWVLTLFARNAKVSPVMEKMKAALEEKYQKPLATKDRRYLLNTFALDTPLDEVIEYLDSAVRFISETVQNWSSGLSQPEEVGV